MKDNFELLQDRIDLLNDFFRTKGKFADYGAPFTLKS